MNRVGIVAGGLALGSVLYLVGGYVGGRMDSRAYPDFAARYGVDCGGFEPSACDVLLENARMAAMVRGEEFSPPSNGRRLSLLGGAFGLAVALSALGWGRR